jgi:MFS transporter, Spinster family, sphingosine-1-phosphate transporter
VNRSWYRNYLLGALLLIYAFNQVDRYALGVVLNDIKADLHLTDTQLGVLSGIAFALFYSVMGIPIARWADRGNRVTIIATTTAVWSGMVALCGAAGSFLQLLSIRVGVAVGEAGCVPPAHSLIADYFTRAERPRASALYQQGLNLSLIIAYFGAGWLNQFYGWRVMFFLIGAPGLLLATLTWLTIREPRKLRSSNAFVHEERAPDLKTTLAVLRGNATYRHLLYAFSMWYFFGYGITQWQPAFFERSFGLTTGELGTWFAIVYGVCGFIGTYWGGLWASRYAANNEPLQLKVVAAVNVAFNGVVWALIYFSHNYHVALLLMGLSALGGTMIYGPLFSTLQTLVPANMRALSIAIVMLCANLIGMGLGPLAVGIISDELTPKFGAESLRYALLAFCPGWLWVSWHIWHASRTFLTDMSAPAASDSPQRQAELSRA